MQAATGDLLASSAALPVQGEQASAANSLFQFTGDWFSHNTATWERVLSSKNWLENSSQAVHILEVGSWEGRSAVWFLQHVCLNNNSSLTAVDCWLGGQLYGERAKACTEHQLPCIASFSLVPGTECLRNSHNLLSVIELWAG